MPYEIDLPRQESGNLLKVLGWTLKADIVFPFLEIVLFASLYLMLTENTLSGTASSDILESLTSNLLYLIILFVGIAGVRGYAIALERGELTRQMIGLGVSRAKIVVLKWLSLFIISLVLFVAIDAAVFIEFVGYFPSVTSYLIWGSAPLLAFAVVVGEQAILLAFLNSLSAALSLGIKRTTVSLLVFFIVAFLGTELYMFGTTGSPFSYLQLGYGDSNIVMEITQSVYSFFSDLSHITYFAPPVTEQFYIGLSYRIVGAIALLAISVFLFVRADLD